MRISSLFFFFLIALFSCKKEKAYDIVIGNVNIVDVRAGKIIALQNVAIKGDRIAKISEEDLTEQGEKFIDGKNKFLIPGLWDMHAHYYWSRTNDRLLLINGVTGVREMFGEMPSIKNIRDSVKKGWLDAPEIYSSGPIIDGNPSVWAGSDTVTTAAQAKEVVAKQIGSGVDFLKVYSLLKREAYLAIAAEAKRNNISFAGHVPDKVSVYEAIASGQKSIEHLYGVMEVCTSNPEMLKAYEGESWPGTEKTKFLLRSFSQHQLDSFCSVLSKSETWVCPTLTVLRSEAYFDELGKREDPRVKYMPQALLKFWKSYITDSSYLPVAKKAFEYNRKIIGSMQRAGVKILAGSDFPNPYCYPGFSIHDEMQLLSEFGLGNAQALKCATYHPAIFMGKEKDFGTVEENKIASLVLLNANPLEKIENTKEIDAVFLRGKYFDKSELQKLLSKIN